MCVVRNDDWTVELENECIFLARADGFGLVKLPSANSEQRRFASWILTAGLHLGVIALIFVPGSSPVVQQTTVLSLSDFQSTVPQVKVAAPRASQLRPVPPTPVEPIAVPPPAIYLPSSNLLNVSLVTTSLGDTGGNCDLTAPVQAALVASEAVRADLPQIPRNERSVANAIMIWNAAWIVPIVGDAQQSLAAHSTIRDTIADTIAAASPDCRLQPQAGPRLIILPGTGDNTVLALGSGVWRWQDVLDTAREANPDPTLLPRPDVGTRLASLIAGSLSLR